MMFNKHNFFSSTISTVMGLQQFFLTFTPSITNVTPVSHDHSIPVLAGEKCVAHCFVTAGLFSDVPPTSQHSSYQLLIFFGHG